MSPLSGIRILDLSRLFPGPACTWYLAGLGALVVRVEPLGKGDATRQVPPFVDGVGAFFVALNGGDRSLAVDLRNPDSHPVLKGLLASYDVLVEGFRPGVLEKLGLSDEVLRTEVMNGASASEVKRSATARGMISLRQDGRDKILERLTTPDEVLRVTQLDLE